jgi:hypothetical protein
MIGKKTQLLIPCTQNFVIKYLFGNVVVVVFQNAFRVDIHQNDIFFIFKNYF